MTTQEKVQAYIQANPKRVMTVQRFSHNLLKHYNSLVRYLVQDGLEKGMERADAEDALQRFAAWGYANDWAAWTERQLTIAFEKDKRPDMRFGFRSMKLKITSQIKDYCNLSHVKNETAYNSGHDSNEEAAELDGDLRFQEDEEQERLESMVEEWQYWNEDRDDYVDVEFQPTDVYLSAITERQAEMISLRHAGWNYDEIGELTSSTKQNVCITLNRGYDALRATFPELARASRKWDFDNTYQRPDGVGTWHFDAFPHDTFESTCGLPQYYTEPGYDCSDAEMWYRQWVTKHDTDTLRVTKEEAEGYALTGLDPAVFSGPRKRPLLPRVARTFAELLAWLDMLDAQDEDRKYYANNTRLFNILGLGKNMNETTLTTIIQRLGK